MSMYAFSCLILGTTTYTNALDIIAEKLKGCWAGVCEEEDSTRVTSTIFAIVNEESADRAARNNAKHSASTMELRRASGRLPVRGALKLVKPDHWLVEDSIISDASCNLKECKEIVKELKKKAADGGGSSESERELKWEILPLHCSRNSGLEQ